MTVSCSSSGVYDCGVDSSDLRTSGVGDGDGVMIAGDVRSLARQFCDAGTTVDYTQYDALSHVTTVPAWAPGALSWLNARFAGEPASSDCGTIPLGNSLEPEQVAPQPR